MAKFLKYIGIGVIFGITLSKAEIISWFRIVEMFNFHSFHMYGVIGSAVLLGILLIKFIKWKKLRSVEGVPIIISPKAKTWKRYLIGGLLFGFGWALTGACPGPMFILLGHKTSVFIVPILAALAGTFSYGLLRNKLPH